MAALGRVHPAWVWLSLTLSGAGALVFVLVTKSDQRAIFLPGKTTSGHHQIELSCQSCHSETFADAEAIQSACESCHAAELNEANDSHPKAKFTDPRNADRVAALDARRCVTCHSEHNPEITQAMGLSMPEDYCYRCHQDIGDERPSHEGLAFDSCDDAGCHNFHDNRALYEDFLAAHMNEPPHLEQAVAVATLPARKTESAHETKSALLRDAFDAPVEVVGDRAEELEVSVHSKAGVNCSECHGTPFRAAVSLNDCKGCHDAEATSFGAGRHGMRLAVELPPMAVSDAVIPMKADPTHPTLTCNSCHSAHSFDRVFAAATACQGCHSDPHTLAFDASPHAALFRDEVQGKGVPGSGVSCATCHLPRRTVEGATDNFVDHNQNQNLRPSEKMVRDVCMQCHGLEFSLNSLADPALIDNNFNGPPGVRTGSFEFVRRRIANNGVEPSIAAGK